MWDDLFRAAAGEDDTVDEHAENLESEANPTKRQISAVTEQQSKKKKRKKSKQKPSHGNSLELLDKILESRNEAIDTQVWSKIPSWLTPGPSLCNSTLCNRWEQESDCWLDAECKNCKRSMLHHSLVVKPAALQNHASNVLAAFLLVRDIRCCCSCILNEVYGRKDRDGKSELEGYAITALSKSTFLTGTDFSSILNAGEADILSAKLRKVRAAAIVLKEKMKQWSKGGKGKNKKFKLKGIFDEILQLIICCDAAYFRMYYLQISGNLPIVSEHAFVPHPPAYFGSKNMAWKVQDYTAELATTMKKQYIHMSDRKWDELMQEFGIEEESSHELDSLSFMHKNRLSESIFLFHKSYWVHSKQAKKQYTESLKHKSKVHDREDLFYLRHETPAPFIVREWRDSCRDLLCNLYAYATISPRVVHDISQWLLKKHIGCKRVVEMGAGTGYVADLLSKKGLNVSAFDVAPTKQEGGQYRNGDVPNEYHGSSPPFYPVNYADSNNLQSMFTKGEVKETALLLCYPPPLSDMAECALKSFQKHGGRTVIHVGEFSGLTGSLQFEKILGGQFDLIYRASCLRWGSDAAEVTIWTKKEDVSKPSLKTLVQCSLCKHVGAKSRLRLCRPLSYCKASCFDDHKDERGVHFALSLVPGVINDDDLITFSGSGTNRHFQSIPCKYD